MPLTKPESPVRNQIRNLDLKHWCKHWSVEPVHVEAAIVKVGRSVTAVRKELALQGLIEKNADKAI
jgi:hypothetical protein